MKPTDLEMSDLPKPTDEPTPARTSKRKGSRFNPEFNVRRAVVAAERREVERPAWMSDRTRLPKRPPGR